MTSGCQCGGTCDPSAKLVAAFRAEAERLTVTSNKFGGWQAVQASLLRIAERLEADDPED